MESISFQGEGQHIVWFVSSQGTRREAHGWYIVKQCRSAWQSTHLDGLGKPKVGDSDVTLVIQQNVFRLEVTVHCESGRFTICHPCSAHWVHSEHTLPTSACLMITLPFMSLAQKAAVGGC